MRKYIPYLLLLVMGFNLFGYFTIFKLKQWSHRSEMAKSEEPTELLNIPISYFKLHLEHHGKEIRWRGSMYDIKSVSYSGGFALVHAINDTREHSLIEGLADYLKTHDDTHKNASKSFAKILKLDFFLTNININILAVSHQILFADYISVVRDGYTGLIVPPPRNC